MVLLPAVLILGGCATPPGAAETAARLRAERVGQAFTAGAERVKPAPLTGEPAADEYLRFALLNHPRVWGAFQEWRASIHDIAPARALPDPRLTLEADIADSLMSLMPGLMFDIMAPGKRAAMAQEATAQSEIAYRDYVNALVQTTAEVRKAWIELAYVDEVIHLREENLGALEQSLAVSAAEYSTMTGMASFEGQVAILNSTAQVRTEVETLRDRRTAARARFKSALGLAPEDRDPPWPAFALETSPLPTEAELWLRIQAANPDLASMRAMVDMAVAGVEVARKAGVPDLALGTMVDVKASPLMFRPQASLSLPIWREKIEASVAAAEARRAGAVARMDAERLTMAAQLAQMISMVREADRMMTFIDSVALPNIERALASAGASYQAGMGKPGMIPELRRMALAMQGERLAALRERELAVTELLTMTAGVVPNDTGLLAETTVVHAP